MNWFLPHILKATNRFSVFARDPRNAFEVLRWEDGYFDATKMCKAFKKYVSHFFATDRTQCYLDALAKDLLQSQESSGRVGMLKSHPMSM